MVTPFTKTGDTEGGFFSVFRNAKFDVSKGQIVKVFTKEWGTWV